MKRALALLGSSLLVVGCHCKGCSDNCPGPTDGGADGGGITMVPDPSTVAPSLDPTVVADFATAVAFLWEGTPPVQIGVASGAIDKSRVGVVRGRILGRDKQPIAGVQIVAAGHPEFGATFSRADGAWDLAVNGGALVTLRFTMGGLCPSQRRLAVRALDYNILGDVVLVARDQKATRVTSGTLQVARGSSSKDDNGERTPTLIFPSGLQTSLRMGDGTMQPASAITVRATEFTVGDNGPQAMPATLPPTSAYTYAVELAADEALAAGATGVEFSQPVPFYLENFLGFPVGAAVPVGYFDDAQGQWVAADSGKVVRILSIANQIASLDVDGSGQPADAAALAALGISDDERRQLAATYGENISLWRAPLRHFSVFDINWGPPAAQTPGQPTGHPDNDDGPCNQKGHSLIECQNQTLGEDLPLVGMPFRLHYRSDRVPGRTSRTSLLVPLTGDTLQPNLTRVDLTIEIAGQVFKRSFAAAPNLDYTFVWNGNDAYGRPLQGQQPVTVTVGYAYSGAYADTPTFGVSGGASLGTPSRELTVQAEQWHGVLGGWSALPEAIGGWSLDPHHVYDPRNRRVYLGNGDRKAIGRSTGALEEAFIIDTLGGVDGMPDNTGDGGPVSAARFDHPGSLATLPDGTFLVLDVGNNRVRRIAGDGTVSAFAGDGTAAFGGDGGPAKKAQLDSPLAIAAAADGTVYIAERARLRRVAPDGTIQTIAGNGTCDTTGDDGPAAAAQICPGSIAVAPDGSVLLADFYGTDDVLHPVSTVRRIDPAGRITRFAGGPAKSDAEGAPALDANLTLCNGDMAAAPDGTLYLVCYATEVRAISGGTIRTIAGSLMAGFSGDGGPASAALLSFPGTMNVAADGTLYLADDARVRRIGPDGVITSIAGNGTRGYSGDGGPPILAQFQSIGALLALPDGSLIVSDFTDSTIRRVHRAAPSAHAGQLYVPSDDGTEVWFFDEKGRHLQTVDAFSGAVRWTFQYDAAGRLSSLTDGDNNQTTITRTGKSLTLVGPYGQTTALSLDANGYLASLKTPNGETWALTHSTDGLLQSVGDPLGAVKTFAYDGDGRLVSDADAQKHAITLARTPKRTGYKVTENTALKLTSTYEEIFPDPETKDWVNTDASGLQTTVEFTEDSISAAYPDGTTRDTSLSPDPRFGMDLPVASDTVTLQSGLQLNEYDQVTTDPPAPSDPLAFNTLTIVHTVDSHDLTGVWDKATRTFTHSTPEGLSLVIQLDGNGHPSGVTLPGRAPITLKRDTHGRVINLAWSTRSIDLQWDQQAAGTLSSFTDPLKQTTLFSWDAALRLTGLQRPDGKTVALSWTPLENLASVTPPGGTAHTFVYDTTGRASQYVPPTVSGAPGTRWVHDADQRLIELDRPDGTVLTYGYDTGGRLTSIGAGTNVVTLSWDAKLGTLSAVGGAGGENLALQWDGALPTRTTWSGAVTGSIAFQYDTPSAMTGESVNGATPIAYAYDGDLRLISAGELAVHYDVMNGLPTGGFAGVVEDNLTYDVTFGERQSYEADANSLPVYTVAYTNDALGRVHQLDETIEADQHLFTYTYDAANRLKQVTRDGASQAQYVYDDNGNRLSNGTIAGTYDAQDRQLTWGAASFTWTPNGELATRADAGGTTSYTWDIFGHLVKVVTPTTTVGYIVDGAGRRVGKQLNGTLTRGYLYRDGLRIAAELDGSNAVVARFIYGAIPGAPDLMIKGGVTYRILRDHLGSPRLVVNTNDGSIAQRMDYDDLGNVINDTSPGFQPFGFAGGLWDGDTGLVHFGARDYDPRTGRWTAKDPTLFGGRDPNLYQYVFGDPINGRDPSGLGPWFDPSAWDVSVGSFVAAVGRWGSRAAAGVGTAFGIGYAIGKYCGSHTPNVMKALDDWMLEGGYSPGDPNPFQYNPMNGTACNVYGCMSVEPVDMPGIYKTPILGGRFYPP